MESSDWNNCVIVNLSIRSHCSTFSTSLASFRGWNCMGRVRFVETRLPKGARERRRATTKWRTWRRTDRRAVASRSSSTIKVSVVIKNGVCTLYSERNSVVTLTLESIINV